MVKHNLSIVKNEATKEATIRLYGVIGDGWFDDEDPLTAQKFQTALNALNSFDRINVRINSPGGSVWEGLAMANAIKASRKEIHTYNDGLAASMASVILVAAKAGNRHAAKGSITMIHSASTMAGGNAKQMRETADALDTHDEVLASFYADATGIDVADIKANYFDGADHYLTAQEAADAGFVTVEDYAVDALPENIKNLSHLQMVALYTPEAKQEEGVSNSLWLKIEAKIQSLIHPNNTEMKFPKLEALAKLGAENVKPEMVDAALTELAEAEIEGVTLVLDAVLDKHVTDLADANLLVQQSVSDLAAKDALIEAKDAEIVALTAKLGEPGADAGGTHTDEDDDFTDKGKVAFVATSVDKEKAAMNKMWGK